MKLSIVVPVYNEEKTINSILDLVEDVLQNLTAITSYELVVIDDCSTDNSKAVLEERISNKKHYTLLAHDINSGKGAAIRTAISKTTGDSGLIQDADME